MSWKYVEKPFRNRNGFTRKGIFLFSVIGSVLFVVFGMAGHGTNGFYNRYTENQKDLLDFQSYDRKEAYREGRCFLEPDQTYSDFKDECFSPNNEEVSVILWGDSHAAALSYGLKKLIPDLTQLTASGCTPLIGYNPISRPHCIDINNFVLSKTEKFKPKLLILHANWSSPLNKIEIQTS